MVEGSETVAHHHDHAYNDVPIGQDRALAEYVACHNCGQPRQGPEQRCPAALPASVPDGLAQRRDRLGGPLHDYLRAGT